MWRLMLFFSLAISVFSCSTTSQDKFSASNTNASTGSQGLNNPSANNAFEKTDSSQANSNSSAMSLNQGGTNISKSSRLRTTHNTDYLFRLKPEGSADFLKNFLKELSPVEVTHIGLQIYKVVFPKDPTLQYLKDKIKKAPLILYVEPNFKQKIEKQNLTAPVRDQYNEQQA